MPQPDPTPARPERFTFILDLDGGLLGDVDEAPGELARLLRSIANDLEHLGGAGLVPGGSVPVRDLLGTTRGSWAIS